MNPKQSQQILSWCIESVLTLIIDAVSDANRNFKSRKMQKYLSDNFSNQGVSRRQINCMIYELKRHKYIYINSDDSVLLTNKAKIKMIDRYGGKSDKKIRFISFDIPERLKSNRDGFRQAIKKLGFVQIQKSLWVSDQNNGEMVELIAKEYGVYDYIAYLIIDKSNIKKHIENTLINSRKTPETISEPNNVNRSI